MIKVGCCGFPMGRGRYFSQFKVVEVQNTFYKPPQVKTAEKWRDQAPPDFEFSLKAWQLITHEPTSPTYRKAKIEIPEGEKKYYGSFKPTDRVFEAWEETKKIVHALKAKIVIFQCPASFVPSDEHKGNLKRFFQSLEREDLLFVWEPRGKWDDEEIKELCAELNLIHGVDPFSRPSVSGRINYFRLHGKEGYRYKYTDEDLRSLLNMCRVKSQSYSMFNNVFMAEDAVRFREILK